MVRQHQTSDVQLHSGVCVFDAPRNDTGTIRAQQKNFFIVFVDAIFTTLFERLFTKLFDVTDANRDGCCVYRACNAD
jgi:hypothetical protein